MNSLHSTQRILKYTFGLLPLAAGIDKFTNLLADWSQYLSIFEGAAPTVMVIVGIIEIVAGLAILFGPPRVVKIFAYIVALWLLLIAVNLIIGGFYDIAVRDIVLAISAVALARLTPVTTEIISREPEESSPAQV